MGQRMMRKTGSVFYFFSFVKIAGEMIGLWIFLSLSAIFSQEKG